MRSIKLESIEHISSEEFSQFGRIIGRYEGLDNYLWDMRPVKPMGNTSCIVSVEGFWDILPFKDMNLRFSLGFNYMKHLPADCNINWTECHKSTYECFIPLDGKQLIFVLAPKGDKPDIEKTRAFLFGPGEGIMLDKGTWHYPPFAPSGITPMVMPRYGEMAEVQGPVTEAFGKKFNTPQPTYRIGMLHAMETYYYGSSYKNSDTDITMYDKDYSIKIV